MEENALVYVRKTGLVEVGNNFGIACHYNFPGKLKKSERKQKRQGFLVAPREQFVLCFVAYKNTEFSTWKTVSKHSLRVTVPKTRSSWTSMEVLIKSWLFENHLESFYSSIILKLRELIVE